MSDREFKVWEMFLFKEWDKPDRHDWYLMQIASLIDSFLSQKYVSPSDMKLRFEVPNEREEKSIEDMTEEEIKQWAEERSNLRLAQLQFQSSRSKHH